MDKVTLLAAIQKSGGAKQPDNEIDGLLAKLACLEQTGRYGGLIKNIKSSNDKNNFLASVFEATFAYHFESAGLSMKYEITQGNNKSGSIDFMRQMPCGMSIYFEARLLQQDDAVSTFIKEQLQKSCFSRFWQVAMNEDDERNAVMRLQSVILSKVQKPDATPIKFLRVADDIANIVVVDVSDLILGAIDVRDCLLATHGDPAVDEIYRRGIFGLFQESAPGYPTQIQAIAKSYEHIGNTLSGVLFLFKKPGSGVLDYTVEHYMMWNPRCIDQTHAASICAEIAKAIPVRSRNAE